MLVLGRVSGVHGLKGWVKIFSETDPRDNILTYQPWYLGKAYSPCKVAEGRRQGKAILARMEGCEDRDGAAALVGQEIAVRRDQLHSLREDELYWVDLEGLLVETLSGIPLGRVQYLFATAANDVLVVKGERERLLPFLWQQVVMDVDLERGRIRVDWNPEF